MLVKERNAEESLMEFRWEIPEDGFRILSLPWGGPGSKEHKFLLAHHPGTRHMATPYDPLKFNPLRADDRRSPLYRDFAFMEPSEPEVLRFANACGDLGIESEHLRVSKKRELFEGEYVSHWKHEILSMRQAVELWQALQERAMGILEGCISLGQANPILGNYEGATVKKSIIRRGREEEFQSLPRAGKLLAVGVFVLQDLIREPLKNHVRFSVLYDPAGGLAPLARSGKPARLPLVLRLVPRNLLGSMWLQFARDVEAAAEYRRCGGCGKRFLVGGLEGGARSDRRTCSMACRAKVYRERKAEGKPRKPRGRPRKGEAVAVSSRPRQRGRKPRG